MMRKKGKVLLIYTGGTIGMGVNPATGALEPLDFKHLKEHLPEFQYIKTDIDIYQFNPPIDSSDMSTDSWIKLVSIIGEQYDMYDGFVILHGTDTMAYTASALSFLLENLTKPVILTGSQLPLGQLRTDGKENILTSIELASTYRPDGTPSRMPTGSTLLTRSTTRTSAMRESISPSTPITSLPPTTANRLSCTRRWTAMSSSSPSSRV